MPSSDRVPVLSLSAFTSVWMHPPEVTTWTISSVCAKCGTIAKSWRLSCCGRGGSWFRNCGHFANAKLHHTWYEGVQSCKIRARSKLVFGRQTKSAQQLTPSNGKGMANFAVLVPAIYMSTATSQGTFTARDTDTATPNAVDIAASFKASAIAKVVVTFVVMWWW